MKEYFKEQIENTKQITKEDIKNLSKSKDYFGTSNEVGDRLLVVMIQKSMGENEDGSKNLTINMVKLLERNIPLLENDHRFSRQRGTIPIFVEK